MSTKNEIHRIRLTPVAVAVCAALATLSTEVIAEPLQQVTLYRNADMSRWSDNYLEFGVFANAIVATEPATTPASNASFKFGEFSGLNKTGLFGAVGFNWITRQPDDDSMYSQVYGENLGLASSKFSLDAGHQGRWRIVFGVDRLTRSETDSARFVHDPATLGTGAITMPTTPSACQSFENRTTVSPTRANDPDIANCLHRFDVQQERDIYRLGVGGYLGRGWDYKISLREDNREGTRLTTVYFAQAPFVVPHPIEDRTQQIEASLSYASKAGQLQLSYLYSRYQNEFESFQVENPFRGDPLVAVTNTPSSSLATIGRMSMLPSNEFHQVSAMGGYNINKTTRLTAQGSYGVSLQDSPFLNYSEGLTLFPDTVAPIADNSPPRSSLDGRLVNTLLDVALMTRPTERMSVKLAAQYRDNDNQTPSTVYTYISRDTAATSTNGPTTTFVRQNVPISYTEQKYTLDTDYEIARRTLLRAVVERSHKTYQLTDRTFTDTTKASLDLRRPVSDEFLGNIGYTFTKREGSDYDKNVFWRNSYPGAAPTLLIDQHPSLRSFMYADYNENRVRAAGTWAAGETVSLQGGVDGFRQHYRGPDCAQQVDGIGANVGLEADDQLPDVCLGRTMADGASVNLDLQWRLEENLATFAFGNIAQTRFESRGRNNWQRRNTSGTIPGPLGGADITKDYIDRLTYRDITLGLGVNWQPEKWDLGAQYIFNRGIGRTEVLVPNGSTQTPTPLPDTENRVHSVQLYAKWNYSKESTWRFNYWIERLMSYDWAYDGVSAPSASPTNFLPTGQSSPSYWNQVIGISYAYTSW